MKTLVLLPALALGLTGCGGVPNLADVEMDGSVEDRAKFIAAFMEPMMPMEENGYKFVEIHPEGKELRLVVHTDMRGMSTDISPFAITKILRPSVCEEGYRGFIEAGGVINFDFRDPNTGKSLPPGKIASCHGV